MAGFIVGDIDRLYRNRTRFFFVIFRVREHRHLVFIPLPGYLRNALDQAGRYSPQTRLRITHKHARHQKEKPSLDEVKTDIASVLAEESEKVDENTYYKALIELREEKGLEINDAKLKETYEKHCKKYTEEQKQTVEETTEGQVVSDTITLE